MKQAPAIHSTQREIRFETENAVALREARAEQRALAAKRKASGVPDRMFVPSWPKSTSVIICSRGV